MEQSDIPVEPPPPTPPLFIRFRLSHIDTVASRDDVAFDNRRSPWSTDGNKLQTVPILRIFGATDRGQRVVAHVHGAFPYFFVEYKGKLNPEEVNTYIYRFGRALNAAMAAPTPGSNNNNNNRKTQQGVAFIAICKGTAFYGYHVGYKTYLKVYLVDPRNKKRAGECLRSGSIMGTAFEVFEDHIPFILQFMLDQNLFGCGWVEVAECLFRQPLPSHKVAGNDIYNPPTCFGSIPFRSYSQETVPASFVHPSSMPSKISYCALELDLPVSAILNRHNVTPRNIHQDFVELLHPETIERGKLVNSVKELWDDENRRRSARGDSRLSTTEDAGPEREWDSRIEDSPIWQSEKELREKVTKIAREDLAKFTSKPGLRDAVPTFEHFIADTNDKETIWLSKIRTTFEQVDAIFAERMERDELAVSDFGGYEFGVWAVRGIGMKRRIDPTKLGASQGIKSKGKERATTSEPPPDFNEALWVSTQGRAPAAHENENSDIEAYDDESPDEDEGQSEVEGSEAGDEDAGEVNEEPTEQQAQDEAVKQPPGREASPDLESDGDGPSPSKRQHVSQGITTPRRKATPQATPSPYSPTKSAFKAIVATQQNLGTNSRFLSTIRNPFTSPIKRVRVRLATSPSDGTTPLPSSPSPSVGPTSTQQAQHAVNDTFSDLPSDTFDDYEPSPTVHEPGPSTVPLNLRSSATHLTTVLGDSQSSSFNTSPMPTPSTDPDATMTDIREDLLEPTSTIEDQEISRGALESSREEPSNPTVSSAADQRELKRPSQISDISSEARHLAAGSTSTPPILAPNCYSWLLAPPSRDSIFSTLDETRTPRVEYKSPFYSIPKDVPPRAREYAGRSFRLLGDTLKFMPPFVHWTRSGLSEKLNLNQQWGRASRTAWEFGQLPPSRTEVSSWLERDRIASAVKPHVLGSQIEGPTQANQGFKFVPVKGVAASREAQHLSVLTIELHVNTRGSLFPDPALDKISAIFYCYQSENDERLENGRSPDKEVGVLAIDPSGDLSRILGGSDFALHTASNELDLINDFIDKVREWDPEIVAGFDIQFASWGYLIERGTAMFDWDLVAELGRLSSKGTGKFGTAKSDRWGFNTSSTLQLTGRHALQIWRTIKADTKLSQHTFEHIAFHILRRRVPHFSFETLTAWYLSGVPHKIARVFEYWRDRVEMDVEILEEGEVISQNCEAARVFGIDLQSVRTRGSQFKVEAVMCRISKPESFLLLSPNRVQVGKQNAAECQPLIMEPQSAFYKGPLVVLDFTSLYPSIMIGYNYCYSTCLGRVGTFKGTSKLGVSSLEPTPGLLHLLQDKINISPNGLMFVKPEVRKSLLAKMLSELLDTRVMVKNGMKAAGDDKALSKLLNARQLALKLLANVTYGYTSATFSGRMPCVEVADAIVQTARETLEKAIHIVNTTPEWGAQVVYGDTDSLFIYLPGKSKADAFKIGHQMAEVVTSQNPRPIKLKFEKVYLPSVLLAKKRYVGFKYERETDLEPDFDAKGIETVRRDGIPATQKMQETCLKILFRTSDLSLVKEYCQRQWRSMLLGNASPQDFIYAKEVKLGTYSDKRAPPPGAMVATRRILLDKRAEPQYGERVPYIIIQSEDRLQVHRALDPAAFLANPRLKIDVTHYITKAMIPPLARIFNLVGADVESWYAEMRGSKPVSTRLMGDGKRTNEGRPLLLEDHFVNDQCLACFGPNGNGGLCAACLSQPGDVAYALMGKYRKIQGRRNELHRMCTSCSATPPGEEVACDSIDCSVLYARKRTEEEGKGLKAILKKLDLI